MGPLKVDAEDIVHALGIIGSHGAAFNPQSEGVRAYEACIESRLAEKVDLAILPLDADELYANSRNAAAFMKQILATELLGTAVKVAHSKQEISPDLKAALFALGGKQTTVHFEGLVNDVATTNFEALPARLNATLNAIDDAGHIGAVIESKVQETQARNPQWRRFIRQAANGGAQKPDGLY